MSSKFLTDIATLAGSWLGVTSTLVATATAIFTTSMAVSANQSNARDRFFEQQLQACTDLGDASPALQNALSDVGAAYMLASLKQDAAAKTLFDKADDDVNKTYADYQKVMTRFYLLYPDSFVPLESKVVSFTPNTLHARASQSADPKAAFDTLHDGFSDADLKLRGACTDYLRGYAKANLIKG